MNNRCIGTYPSFTTPGALMRCDHVVDVSGGETLHGGYCHTHCKFYLDINARQKSAFNTSRFDSEFDRLHKLWVKHCIEFHGWKMPTTTHTGNGAHQGMFAFTLTKSTSDELSEEDMLKAVRKVMNQKSCPVKKFAWYLEYGDPETKQHPHIHGLYETESQGRIEAKHFKRAWPIWDERAKLGKGFRGGYHRPVLSEEGYSDYIAKDGGVGEKYNVDP